MKTIFLQPPDPPEGKVLRGLAGRFGIRVRTVDPVVLPPLEFAYAASVLEKNGYEFEIIDAPALDLNVQGVLKKLLESGADLVVINTTPTSFKNDLEICGLIKGKLPETWVCLTGPFVSVFPEIALNDSGVDIVIRNEIEYTVLELSKAIEENCFEDVEGIAYKKNGEIVRTQNRPLIMNLDELPFPAYHCLPVDEYCHYWLPEKPFMTMSTSRGCPFGCIYCPYPVGYGGFWRGRSPENVLDEIHLYADDFHVKSILFRDQVFTFDMKKTEQICKGIVEREIDIQWRCETRVDRLSKELMKVMKDAGCIGLHLGVESGDSKILSGIGKHGVNIDMVKKVFADADELEIETGAFFMIGLPGETRQSIWKSFKLAMDLNPDFVHLGVVTPYPGTELYRLAEEKGWILTRDWTKYTGFEVVMRTDDLSKEEIKRALEYWKTCVVYRRKTLQKEVFSKKGVKNAFRKPLRALRWPLRASKYYVTSPQKKFEKWALDK